MASSACPTTRPRQSRYHLGVALLAGFACLTSPALAEHRDSSSDIAHALPTQPLTAVAEEQPAPTDVLWNLLSPIEDELKIKARAKDDDEDEESSTTEEIEDKTKTVTVHDKATATEEDSSPARTSTMELSVTVSEPTGSPSPLPAAFDGNIASEFKTADEDDSCPNFIENLLGSDEFQRCYPFSMLMQTSSSFFQAQKQLVSIVRVLDASCKADVDTCSDFMRTAARNLTESENCEAEWENGLTTVMQAYRGLMAYEMMYTAACLQDPETENYCFATSVTNTSTPSDTYLYFLPYNLSMPGSSSPSCTWCNQEVMGIFHAASANRRQLIATTYEGAARQVNTMCGQAFVNGTLPEEEESASGMMLPQGALALTIMLASAALNLVL
jgi:hypothetical protein